MDKNKNRFKGGWLLLGGGMVAIVFFSWLALVPLQDVNRQLRSQALLANNLNGTGEEVLKINNPNTSPSGIWYFYTTSLISQEVSCARSGGTAEVGSELADIWESQSNQQAAGTSQLWKVYTTPQADVGDTVTLTCVGSEAGKAEGTGTIQ